MDRPHALVIGGSLSGLFSAALLRRIGWDVTVFERTAGDLSGRGTGLGTREELFAVIRRIGIRLDDSFCVGSRSRIGLDDNGKVVCELPIRAVETAWDCIYRALRATLPDGCYRAGMQVERFEQSADIVTACFADGSSAEGDLLIGADGMRSTVRRQLLPGLQPRYAGYVNWRGVVDDEMLPAALRPMLLHHMVFGFPEGELMFSVPMPGAPSHSPPGRRVQFVWFRPVDYEYTLPRMCTDARGHRHGVSIPPPLIRSDILDDLRQSAARLLPPQLAILVKLAAQPVLQPIYDLESPQLTFGRAVLVGDAAFVARPHVGTGVTKAALDAHGLAEALAATPDSIGSALSRYDRERRLFGHTLVARGRYLGGHLEAQFRPGRDIPTRNRTPETVMREIGAEGVIDRHPDGAWLAY